MTALTTRTRALGDSRRFDERPAALGEALRRFGAAVALGVLVGAAAGLLLSLLVPTTYVARNAVYPNDPRTPGVFGLTAPGPPRESLVLAVADAATSEPLAEAVAEQLDVPADEMLGRVRARATYETGVVELSASGSTAAGAARTLQAVTEELDRTFLQERQRWLDRVLRELDPYEATLRERVKDADRELQDLRTRPETSTEELETLVAEREAAFSALLSVQSRRNEVKVDALAPGSGLYRPAAVATPQAPNQPRRSLLTLTGAMLGLLVATAVAWRRTEDKPVARGTDGVAEVLSAPCLTLVGEPFRRPGLGRRQRSLDTVPPAQLAALLRSAAAPGGPGTVLLQGLRRDTDTPLAALTLAVQASRQGLRVLLHGVGDGAALDRLAGDPSLDRGVVTALLAEGLLQNASPVRSVQARRSEGVELSIMVVSALLGDAGAQDDDGRAPVVLVVRENSELAQLALAGDLLRQRHRRLLGFALVSGSRLHLRVRTLEPQVGRLPVRTGGGG